MVYAEIKQHPAARCAPGTPFRKAALQGSAGGKCGAHQLQLSKGARLNHFAGPPNQAMPAEIESHHNLARRTSGLLEELITFPERYRERFFDEYMFAGFERSQGNLGMPARRYTNRDSVNIGVGQQSWIIRITTRDGEEIGGQIQAACVAVSRGDDLPFNEAPESRKVQAARDPSTAYKADPQLCSWFRQHR